MPFHEGKFFRQWEMVHGMAFRIENHYRAA